LLLLSKKRGNPRKEIKRRGGTVNKGENGKKRILLHKNSTKEN
jgi:hypothetical protein